VNSQNTHRSVITLFQGHPQFIERYAAFIPPGHTIDIPADPQGNILVTIPTASIEITRDGTVVKETRIQAPGPQDGGSQGTKLPHLAEREKRVLESLRARIAGAEEQEEYKALIKLFEAKLEISSKQREVRDNATVPPETFSLTSGQGFTGCQPGPRFRGETPGTSRG
jgi:histone deacetylase complex regulatory component SIN3